jgi:hypothetical protein
MICDIANLRQAASWGKVLINLFLGEGSLKP